MKRIIQLSFALLLIVFSNRAEAQEYFSKIDLPYGAMIYDNGFATDFKNTMIVCSSSNLNNKYYKSTNNGETWDRLTGFPEFEKIFITKNGYYFVSGGEYTGKGLYLSKDNGINWESINNGIETWTIDDLVMDYENRIFILTSKYENFVWYYGIYRTEDMGKNWTRITKGIGDQIMAKICVDSKGILFADRLDSYIPGSTRTIYKSTNHGDLWKVVNNKNIVTELNIGANDEIYAGAYDGKPMIVKSTDSGESWETSEIKYATLQNNDGPKLLTTTKSGDIIVFMYFKGFLISKDQGKSWKECNGGLPPLFDNSLSYSLLYNEINGEIINAGFNGLFIKKNDEKSEWRNQNTGMKGFLYEYIASDYNNNFFIGGNGQLFKYINSSGNWKEITKKPSNDALIIAPNNIFVLPNNKLLLLDRMIYIFSDEGENWTETGDQYHSSGSNFIGAYATKDGKVVVWKGDGICNFSEDYGNTWTSFAIYLPGTTSPVYIKFDSKMNYYALNPGWTKSFYFSSDDKKTWKDIASQIPPYGSAPEYFELDSQDNVYGLWYISTDYPHYEMHYSQDHGNTWQKVGNNIDVNYIREFFVLENGNVFVGTGEGLIRKTKNSNEWVKLSHEAIEKIILTKDNRLAALSLNEYKEFSLLIADNSITSIKNEQKSIPIEYSLSQNYPNPFNSETNILYNLPEPCNVSIRVFDILGREIVKLIDNYQQPGVYNIYFNSYSYHLSTGIYFYQIKAGSYTDTKRMIYLK